MPDLVVELESLEGHRTLALEVDRGTEPLQVIRQKLAHYEIWQAASIGFAGLANLALIVVLIDAGERRARSIEELLAEQWTGAWFVVRNPADLDEVLNELAKPPQSNPQGVLGALDG